MVSVGLASENITKKISIVVHRKKCLTADRVTDAKVESKKQVSKEIRISSTA